jgi:hypothetical protein
VRLRILPSMMRTAALAKTFADVHHYDVTLLDSTGQPVTAPGLTNPIRVDAPATTGTLSPVPEGRGYTLSVEAFDAGGASISRGGGARSANTFAVAGGVVTYSAGEEAVCNLNLVDATAGSDATRIGLPDTDLSGADRHGLALLNNFSHRAMVQPPDSETAYDWQGVQTGAQSHSVPTHEVWGWFANSAEGLATVARRVAFPADPSGTIAATLTFGSQMGTLETIPAGAITTTLGLRADGAGRIFYSSGTKLTRYDTATRTATDIDLTGPITAFTVDGAGTVYTTDGNGIRIASGPLLLNGASIGPMAIDDEKTLYWFDPTTLTIKRSRLFFGSYLSPEIVCTAPADTRMLAVDAYGDPLFSNGTNVMSARFDETGMALASGPVTYLTINGLRSLAVDKVGNLYVTDGSNLVKMHPVGETPGTLYTVAGNGTVPAGGADALGGFAPTQTDNLARPEDLAVSPTGTVYLTSAGSAGIGRRIRVLAP